MKRQLLSFAAIALACSIWSCNSDTSSSTPAGPDSNKMNSGTDTQNNNGNMSSTPLSKEDSTFVMEAAVAGLMEVQAGKMAQQNAMNPRVKNFGAMMVADHTKASEELQSYAASHGMTLPASLPEAQQKHMNEMAKMTGKAFDNHYMGMMNDDHKKVIDKFTTQANSGGDPALKTWAGNTLPTLKTHLDSAQAIKSKM